MKYMLIGDLHYGEKGGSPLFGKQLNELAEWVVDVAKERNITKAIQVGDVFHNRNSINVQTINQGIDGIKTYSDYFGRDNFHIIIGNHDLYHKDRLDVTSLKILEPYATIVAQPTMDIGNGVLLASWVIDNKQWDELVTESRVYDYVVGHFEFNGFKMNDAYVMEHGNSYKELRHCKRVLSGHFHSPQEMGNVTYLGTPIANTFSEANEPHGVYMLDTDTNELEFIEYDKVKTISISYEDIDMIEDLDPENTNIRIEFPDDYEDESAISEVQQFLIDNNFSEVKIKYKGNKAKELLEAASTSEVEEVGEIDAVVKNHIKEASDVNGVDKERLIKYYDMAIEHGGESE